MILGDVRRQDREDRRAGDFGHIVSDKQRAERFFELVQNIHDTLRPLVAVVGHGLDLDLIGRGERAFRSGEIRAADHTKNKCAPQRYTVTAHMNRMYS